MSTKRPAEVVVPASLGARAPVDGRAKRIRFGDDGEVEEEQLPEAKVFSTGREVPAWHLVQQEAAIEAPAAAAAAKAAAKKDMYRNKRDDRAGAAAGAGGGDGDGDGAPNRATAKKEKIVPQVPKLSEAERKALQKQRRRVDRLKSEATILKAKHAPATPEPSAADASPDTSLEAIAAAAAAATTRDVDADETPDTNTAALDGGADDADAAADTAAQKKTKKKAKKAKGKTAAKPAAGGAASDESEASKGKQAALEYLDMFTNNRKMWKFQKVRQIWILRNMYYPSLVSLLALVFVGSCAGLTRRVAMDGNGG
ncbi:hypothetical protein BC831DRAFT_465556 [Entophlyctis helioformis]|nr:hypothetical protein BC831DRAFT_465556 [Entophlyctis helioformis]